MTDPFSTQGPPAGAPEPPDQTPPQAPQTPPQAPQAPAPQPPIPQPPQPVGATPQIPGPPQPGPPPGTPDLGATQVFPGLGQTPPAYVADLPTAHDHAGFGTRLLAWILDRVIMLLIISVISIPLVWWMVATFETEIVPCSNGISTCEQPTDDTTIRLVVGIGLIVLAALTVSLLYQLIGLARSGQTPGRRIMNIRVITEDTGLPPGYGKALLRMVVGWISGQILYIGHLWRLWDDKHQTWHDKAANTVVVRG